MMSGAALGRFVSPPGLFRLFLAYVVVVTHFTPIHFGTAAVYLFFILSGFWIYQMWGKEYAPTAAPYRTFVISRLWRLLPVYYVAVVAWILLHAWFGVPRAGLPDVTGWTAVHFWFSHVFLLGYAWLPLPDKLAPVVWSLDVELQFYLVAPLVIWMLVKYSFGAWPRLALYAVALWGVADFIAYYNGPNNFIPQSASLPMYLAFFLIGMLSARHGWKPRENVALAGVAIACVATLLCIAVPAWRELLFSRKVHGALADYNGVANIVVALLFAAYAIATVRKRPPASKRFAAFDRDLGNVSYEVYLLHGLAEVIVTHYFGQLPRAARLPFVVVAGVAILPFSWLVYRFFDRPIDRLRSAWVKSQKRAVAAPAGVEQRPLFEPS